MGKTLKALWIGGPPGSTIKNITLSLRREGVEIVEQWIDDSAAQEKHRIPTMIDVILFNHEMASHHLQESIKTMAKKANKPFVLSCIGSRKTITELYAKGVLKEKVAPMAESKKEKAEDPDTIKIVMDLIIEREVLRKQSKGIRDRLAEIEQRLTNIRNGVYAEK